jgi:XTP/dITP diphosphohydrolase
VRLLLASRNPHKAREFGALLEGVEVVALPDGVELPPETGDTFEANALPKARAARFAGADASDADNLARLVAEAPAGSALAYVCVIALVDPETGEERTFEGRCTGTMAPQPRGSGGFGYDPIFIPDDRDDGRTMAQLTQAEKDAISHRGRAARALLEHLRRAGVGVAP